MFSDIPRLLAPHGSGSCPVKRRKLQPVQNSISNSMAILLGLATSLLLLSACQTPASKPPSSDQKTSQSALSRPTPESGSGKSSSTEANNAAAEFRLRAYGAMREDEYKQANRLLNRAIRLAPREAQNYLALAKLRLLEKNISQAEQLAGKGLALNPDQATRAALQDVLRQTDETRKAKVDAADPA